MIGLHGAISYTLDLLATLAGMPESTCHALAYDARGASPTQDGAPVTIVSSPFFSEAVYGTPASLPSLPLPEIEGVPLLFGTPEIERCGNQLVVHADIIASTYFLVTRYEEMVRRDVRDEHGRFPGRESLPHRAGFLDRPIVEEYAALLRSWLREVGVDVREPKREFSMLLTHDVDSVRKYRHWWQPARTAASAMLGRQPLSNIAESLAVVTGARQDPFDTFDELIALDGSVDVPYESVYFVMAGGNTRLDGHYNVQDQAIRTLVRKLSDSGAAIGLHASYHAGLQPERVAAEKNALEEATGLEIHRNRHHYLAWREPEDGWELARAGINWDATLGYADVAGFRLGVCHPIPLFDPVSLRPMGIVEHPLIVMDCTLDRPSYMGLDEEAAFNYCKDLLEEARKHGGEFVMLWHNTSLAPSEGNYHRGLYRRLLACADSKGA